MCSGLALDEGEAIENNAVDASFPNLALRRRRWAAPRRQGHRRLSPMITVDIVDKPAGKIVHLRRLPGAIDDYQALVRRALSPA